MRDPLITHFTTDRNARDHWNGRAAKANVSKLKSFVRSRQSWRCIARALQ
jgi:hypothetical protein